MTQNLLIQEISPSVQKNLKQLDLQLKPIHPLNVAKILELESEIRQYASHQQSEYFKKGLLELLHLSSQTPRKSFLSLLKEKL